MTREDFDHEARILLKPESGNGNLLLCVQRSVTWVL